MSVATRLGAFAAATLISFGGAYAVGSAVGSSQDLRDPAGSGDVDVRPDVSVAEVRTHGSEHGG